MRPRIQRRGLVPALVVAVVGTAMLYLASTVGLSAWHSSRADPIPGAGTLPTIVENAPASVPTSKDYGPPGGVAMVFAGTDVRDGLFSALAEPWIAVTSHGGDYRALVAPQLPRAGPGVMTVSRDGNLLAWPAADGLVLYDTVTDKARTLPVRDVEHVGAFSPDDRMLLTSGEELAAVDLGSGEIVASVAAARDAWSRAAWRPDSSAFDLVTERELSTVGVPEGTATTQPTEIPRGASLAWSPTGDRLVSLRTRAGVKRLFLSSLAPDGTLGPGERVNTEGTSLDRLLGFSGERTISVVAFLLESGSVERILDIPLDGRSPTDLMTLPSPGENWVSAGTLAIAADNLVAGSTPSAEHVWPWSYLSRLVACVVLGLFLLGLYVTRRPRKRSAAD